MCHCRPADRPQRGGRGQPGGDSGIRQSIQDPPPVLGPDTNSGGAGAERSRGAGLQPVRHLQVRTASEERDTRTITHKKYLKNMICFCQMKSGERSNQICYLSKHGNVTNTQYIISKSSC